MKHRGVSVVGGLLLAGVLVACGGPSSPGRVPTNEAADVTVGGVQSEAPAPKPEEPKVTGHGIYSFAYQGGTGIILLPADGPADVEALRVGLGEDPVTYLSVDVDNRQGASNMGMYRVDVFTKAGKRISFSGIDALIDSWEVDYQTDGDALNNQSIDVYNKYLYGVSIGERKTVYMAAPVESLPKDITRVSVHPSGAFDEVLATKGSLPANPSDESGSAPDDAAFLKIARQIPGFDDPRITDRTLLTLGKTPCRMMRSGDVTFDEVLQSVDTGNPEADSAMLSVFDAGIKHYCPDMYPQ